jgi:hypothetical protein
MTWCGFFQEMLSNLSKLHSQTHTVKTQYMIQLLEVLDKHKTYQVKEIALVFLVPTYSTFKLPAFINGWLNMIISVTKTVVLCTLIVCKYKKNKIL